MISQSYKAHIYFPHADIDLGRPAASFSEPLISTYALAPPPTPACVLASHVLASQNMTVYASGESAFANPPRSTMSRMKKLLPKLIEKLQVGDYEVAKALPSLIMNIQTVKAEGIFDVLLSKKGHGGTSSRQQLELRDEREEEERQSSEEECFDSRSSVSSSSYGDDDDDDRITWGDNKSGSSDCVSEGHADEDEEEDC